jgi:arylsulfatase A-like enzyme
VVAKALSCVDFLPTVLSLMNVRTAGAEEGRDASALFMGKTPSGWKDIAFLRGTGNWLCAVTDSHKIVYATKGVPWLFDLSKDPDELTNFFKDAQYHAVVRDLTAELLAYCRKYNDPRGEDAKIKGEMAAALR